MMRSPSVIVDLSPVARVGEWADWRRVDALVKAWKQRQDSRAVVYGVADESLLRRLDEFGRREFRRWQREGRAQQGRWADEIVCEMGEEHPYAAIITSDMYRDLRRRFPYLQGCDRFYTFDISDRLDVEIIRRPLEPITESEMSLYEENAERTPKGLKTAVGQRLLLSEWACDNSGCFWSSKPAIEEFPRNENGRAVCPQCGERLRRLGEARHTVELKVLVDGKVRERVPLVEGSSVTIGRGGGELRFDVRLVMEEKAANQVSRNHIQVTNQAGRLLFTDMGSRNGSTLRRSNGDAAPLVSEIQQVLGERELVQIPGGMGLMRSGKRQPRGQYVGARMPLPGPMDTRLAGDEPPAAN
jgi:hypothetical protein